MWYEGTKNLFLLYCRVFTQLFLLSCCVSTQQFLLRCCLDTAVLVVLLSPHSCSCCAVVSTQLFLLRCCLHTAVLVALLSPHSRSCCAVVSTQPFLLCCRVFTQPLIGKAPTFHSIITTERTVRTTWEPKVPHPSPRSMLYDTLRNCAGMKTNCLQIILSGQANINAYISGSDSFQSAEGREGRPVSSARM
jgi:hypothetical protein